VAHQLKCVNIIIGNMYFHSQDLPYEFDRLAPETGQVGRNSFLDGGDSPLNLDLWSEEQDKEKKR